MDYDRYAGRYKLISQENFDDYLKAIGLSWARRAVARAATTVHTCSVDQETGKWTVETRMLLRENFATFKLGEETEHTTLDGRLIKLLCVLDGTKMIHKERWDNDTKEATYIHDIDGEDWTTTIMIGDVRCVRKYKRMPL